MGEFYYSDKYDGRHRKLVRLFCANCNQPFGVPPHLEQRARFCSIRCSGLAQRRRASLVCSTCQTPITRVPSKIRSKTGFVFCSRVCKELGQRVGGLPGLQPSHYNTGEADYRRRALAHYGPNCRCGYDQDVRMLDVHHKNGDRTDNDLKNLEVLCVWCHRLETLKVPSHGWDGKLGT